MSGPYRDTEHVACPSCGEALRNFHGRLCCDACCGIMLELEDLGTAITEHAGVRPDLQFSDGTPGSRACPRCKQPMVTSHLDAGVIAHSPPLAPTLDRCATHGVWFDAEELADILAVLRRSVEPSSRATVLEIAKTIIENYGRRW